MRRAAVALALSVAGCCCLGDRDCKTDDEHDGHTLGRGLAERIRARRNPPPQPPTFSQYHLPGFSWANVDRVLVLPFLNESQHTRAGEEVRAALTSQLQRLGRFEVVSAAADERDVFAAQVHRGGRFDELAMIALAKRTSADVVVHGIVTHYSPYPRPRLGVILQAVGPAEAKVVASVDGMWDTTDAALAERCRTYYRQRAKPKPAFVRNHAIATDDAFAEELALDSPALFQRWVCFEAGNALLELPVPGVLSPGANLPSAAQNGPPAGAPPAPPPPVPPATAGNVK
jgi:hypothetical protein